jgi:hypothetical protein
MENTRGSWGLSTCRGRAARGAACNSGTRPLVWEGVCVGSRPSGTPRSAGRDRHRALLAAEGEREPPTHRQVSLPGWASYNDECAPFSQADHLGIKGALEGAERRSVRRMGALDGREGAERGGESGQGGRHRPASTIPERRQQIVGRRDFWNENWARGRALAQGCRGGPVASFSCRFWARRDLMERLSGFPKGVGASWRIEEGPCRRAPQ